MPSPLTALVVGCVVAAPLAVQAVPVVAAPPASSASSEPAPPATASATDRLDLAPLEALVDEAAADGVRLSVGVQSLGAATLTDEPVVVGSTERYFAASLVKLALVTTVLRQVDRGELSLDQVETVTGSDAAPGAGVLADQPLPHDATVAELGELAITVSDNTASNVLAELVGLDAVEVLVQDLGLEPTHMGRLFFSSGPRSESNGLDTASTVELMRALYEGEVLSPASRDLLLGWMRDQQMDAKLAPALPGVPVASKTGDTDSVSHAGAYLLEPGRETVLVVLSEVDDGRLASEQADPYLAEAARLVHRQVAAAPLAPSATPTAADDGASGGDATGDATDDADRGEPGGAGDESGGAASPGLTVVIVGVVVLALTVLARTRLRALASRLWRWTRR